MVTNQNEQTFTYDHSNQLAYGNLRGLENFSPFSEKTCQSVSDYSRYVSFEEEHRLNSLKKENDKRPLADVSPSQVGHKRPKQVSDSDEVACSGPLDSSWFNLDSSVWVPSFPNYYDCPTVIRSAKVKPTRSPFRESSPVRESSPFRDGPFHKPVAIGSNHQADIPSWNDKHADCYNDSDKWVEDCVISMPDSNSVLNGQIECDCMDEGSIECVRKHVYEAREKLRKGLGQEKFEKLGFCDMGEEVALNWREEDERLFEQVVLCNPKSADLNFWEELPKAFPYKSREELVGYYFNVFMLRKRAGQNRFDLTNVDSDDDEWQETQNESLMEEDSQEDGEEEEEEEEEEEDDSGIESISDGDELVSNYDFITEDNSEKSFVKECKQVEPCFGFDDFQNDSCTSFDESVNCENIPDGFGVILDDGFFHDAFNTSDNYFMGKGKDDFSEMGNAFEEFIRTENWEF